MRQLREEPYPDPMAEWLMEMYREWCRAGRPCKTRAGVESKLRTVGRDLEGS